MFTQILSANFVFAQQKTVAQVSTLQPASSVNHTLSARSARLVIVAQRNPLNPGSRRDQGANCCKRSAFWGPCLTKASHDAWSHLFNSCKYWIPCCQGSARDADWKIFQMLAEVLIFEPVSPHACPLLPPKLQHPLSWSSATSLAVTSCSWGKKTGGTPCLFRLLAENSWNESVGLSPSSQKAKSWNNSPGPHYKSWYKCSINHFPTMVYSSPWMLSPVQGPQPSTVAAFSPLFQSLEMSDSDQTHAFRSWMCEEKCNKQIFGCKQ